MHLDLLHLGVEEEWHNVLAFSMKWWHYIVTLHCNAIICNVSEFDHDVHLVWRRNWRSSLYSWKLNCNEFINLSPLTVFIFVLPQFIVKCPWTRTGTFKCMIGIRNQSYTDIFGSGRRSITKCSLFHDLLSTSGKTKHQPHNPSF